MRIFAYQSAENGTRLFDLDDHMCKIGLWETHLSEVIRARLCVCVLLYACIGWLCFAHSQTCASIDFLTRESITASYRVHYGRDGLTVRIHLANSECLRASFARSTASPSH